MFAIKLKTSKHPYWKAGYYLYKGDCEMFAYSWNQDPSVSRALFFATYKEASKCLAEVRANYSSAPHNLEFELDFELVEFIEVAR